MTLVLDGSKGISIPDGTVTEPSIRGVNSNTGIFYVNNDISFTSGGTERLRIAANGAIIANGTVTANGAPLTLGAGTVSAPSLTVSDDTNTGMFFPAADTIAFAEGGVEAMRLDSSGNMGLGVASPAARFDLGGDYKEGVVTANTGTAYTIALTGTVQNLTLTGSCTFTFPAATTAGRSFLLILRQDSTGSRTVTWPAAVRWPGGTAPTITATASRYDLYAFTADGSVWLGRTIAQNYAA